jgi:AcrR family transcriptional regulator
MEYLQVGKLPSVGSKVATDNNVCGDNSDANDNILGKVEDMTDRPYHHGRLRATLLAEAERTLREQGIGHLSLRDLARQAGVSHAAPRRHFADRQALLDALAEAGFTRLGDEVRAAIDEAGEDHQARLRAAAAAWVRFATRDAALLELMFAAKNAEQPVALQQASARLVTAVGDLIRQGQQAGTFPSGDPERLRLLLLATLQGIAALVTSGKVQPAQADALIIDAAALFTRSQCLRRFPRGWHRAADCPMIVGPYARLRPASCPQCE